MSLNSSCLGPFIMIFFSKWISLRGVGIWNMIDLIVAKHTFLMKFSFSTVFFFPFFGQLRKTHYTCMQEKKSMWNWGEDDHLKYLDLMFLQEQKESDDLFWSGLSPHIHHIILSPGDCGRLHCLQSPGQFFKDQHLLLFPHCLWFLWPLLHGK